MLKIEKLQPKDNVFTIEDRADHGDALLKVKNSSFTGEYHLHEAGTAAVVSAGVAAKRTEELTGITLDNEGTTNINLTLTKKVVRTFKVEENQTTIKVPNLSLTAAEKIDVDSTSAATVSSVDEHSITIASATKGDLVLELTVLVATGVATDDDVATGETLKLEAGETSAKDVHIDLLSNLRVNPGAKPNLTHFSVRGAKLHF